MTGERGGWILMSEWFLLWSFDGWIYAPQGFFGLGRHERLIGIRILADPGSLTIPWLGSSRLQLVPLGSLQGLDVLRGWSSETRLTLWGCTWGPALKEGRPLEGGGSCLVRLARDPNEHLGVTGAKPLAPPGLSAGRDTRLWRRRGCSMRGQVGPADRGVTEFCSITAGALPSCWAADARLSLSFTPRDVPKPGRCRWVLRRWLNLLVSADLDTSAKSSSTEQSASLQVSPSGLLFMRSLWSSVGGVFTVFSWWRGSLRQRLKGCSIWGCRGEKRHFRMIWKTNHKVVRSLHIQVE